MPPSCLKKTSVERVISFCMFLFLGTFTSGLMLAFSKDWPRYIWVYEHFGSETLRQRSADFILFAEPLYHYGAKFFGDLIGFSSFSVITTTLLLVVKLHYLEKITGRMLGGIFFYVCLYLLLFEGTAIRIGLATSLVIPALYYLRQQRPLISFALILAASQIHLSTLVFLVVFPIYYSRGLTIFSYFLLASAPWVILLDISMFNWIREMIGAINPRYLHYGGGRLHHQNSTGLYFYFIAFFIFTLALVQRYLKETIARDDFIRMLQTLCVLAIVAMCLFYDHVAIGGRLGELLLLPLVILLSLLSLHFKQQGLYWHRRGLISVFLLFFAARFHYLYPQVLKTLVQ